MGLLHRSISSAKSSSAKSKSPRIGAVVDGTPLILLKDGNWQNEILRDMHLAPEDVMAASRIKGVTSIFKVKYAILKYNSSISIIKADEEE